MLAPIKVPHYSQFVDTFPIMVSGKIEKYKSSVFAGGPLATDSPDGNPDRWAFEAECTAIPEVASSRRTMQQNERVARLESWWSA